MRIESANQTKALRSHDRFKIITTVHMTAVRIRRRYVQTIPVLGVFKRFHSPDALFKFLMPVRCKRKMK